LQHHVAGEEDVIVAEQYCASERGGAYGQRDDQKRYRAHAQRPSKPAGRTASVNSKKPNDTAGAQDGP
jgi:hypothetical protein